MECTHTVYKYLQMEIRAHYIGSLMTIQIVIQSFKKKNCSQFLTIDIFFLWTSSSATKENHFNCFMNKIKYERKKIKKNVLFLVFNNNKYFYLKRFASL